jgi:uncharacterized protein with PQ loop repeat
MKRFIVPAILIFPVLSLVAWMLWGVTRPRNLPNATNTGTNLPVIVTNAISDQTNGPLAK